MMWNIPLSSLSQLSKLCTLITSCPLTAYLLGAEWEKESVLAMCEHCSATAKTLLCYQHCFSHKSEVQHCTGC